jgi:hypothetical protein
VQTVTKWNCVSGFSCLVPPARREGIAEITVRSGDALARELKLQTVEVYCAARQEVTAAES